MSGAGTALWVYAIETARRPRKEVGAFSDTPAGLISNMLEGIEEHRVGAALLIYRKVAFEHASLGPEGVNTVPYILAPKVRNKFRSRRLGQAVQTDPVDTHAYTANLHRNVFVPRQRFQRWA